MFDGVGWAAAEIVVFMGIATVIGLAIGWIIGRWLLRGVITDGHQGDIDAERQRAERAEKANADGAAELEEARQKLEAERVRFAELEVVAAESRAAMANLELELGGISERDVEIERLTREVEIGAELATRLESRVEGLAEAEAKAEQLQAELQEATAAAERTAGERVAQEKMAEELETARARVADADRLESELASCALERDNLSAELDRLQIELRDTQTRQAAAAAVAVEGAAESEAEEPPGTPPHEPASPPAAEPVASAEPPSREDALARMSEIAARTAGDGPVADDDLKKVHGIGPKLERTLKDLGITSFRQIANLQAEDVALVTAALDAFKGRIERDDWMSSAAEQHMSKYGESA